MFSHIASSLKKSKYNPYIDVLKNKDVSSTFDASSILSSPMVKYQSVFCDESIKDILLSCRDFNNKYTIEKDFKLKKNKGVFLISDVNDKKKYICRIRRNNDDTEFEINVCKKLTENNNYIANYITYNKLDKYTYFIMEYVDGITLYSYSKQKELSIIEKLTILKKILHGLEFLHSINIIHCDIKLDNVMITNNNNIKIIDFDMSKVSETGEYLSDTIFGTSKYISPESHDIGIYAYKSDIWSLGILSYVFFCKYFPYNISMSLTSSHSNLFRRNEFKHPNMKYLQDYLKNKKQGDDIYNIIVSMLCFNMDHRCDTKTCINKINTILLKIDNI